MENSETTLDEIEAIDEFRQLLKKEEDISKRDEKSGK